MQPPQSPYGQPDFKPPVAPEQQGPRGVVSLDVIGEGWTLLMANLGQWIGAMAVYWGISIGFLLLRNALTGGRGARASGAAAAIGLFLVIANFVLTRYLNGGVTKMAVGTTHTRVANLNEMWSASGQLLQLCFAAFLQGLIAFAAAIPGLALLTYSVFMPLFALVRSGTFVPGARPTLPAGFSGSISLGLLLIFLLTLPLSTLLCLTTSLIVDRKMGATEAIGASWGAIRPHLFPALGLFFVLGLINIVGFLACCIGFFLFTFPLTYVCTALVYRDLFGGGSALAPTTGTIAPPLANPNF